MADLSIINISTTDGTVQYARVAGVDRPDIVGTFGPDALDALVSDGWVPRVGVPLLADGTSTSNSVILTR